jgi:hypothetical protein
MVSSQICEKFDNSGQLAKTPDSTCNVELILMVKRLFSSQTASTQLSFSHHSERGLNPPFG